MSSIRGVSARVVVESWINKKPSVVGGGASKPHSGRSVWGSMETGKHTTITRLAEHLTDISRCCTRQSDRLDSLPLHSGYLLDIFDMPMYCGNSCIRTPIYTEISNHCSYFCRLLMFNTPISEYPSCLHMTTASDLVKLESQISFHPPSSQILKEVSLWAIHFSPKDVILSAPSYFS